jgi:uncharacterized lipoprotein YmbA
MKQVLGFACAFLAALLMVGCGGKVRYPKYSTLALAPPPQAAENNPRITGAVAVRKFEAPAYLRQGRIVYREAPNEVGFYEYHRWAADPGATVTTAVMEALRSSGSFSIVEPYDGRDKPEYLLTGRLERLDEIDYGGGVRVEATLTAQLVNLRTASTVWTGEATQTSRVEQRTVSSVVEEMNRAVQRSIDRLLASMEQQLAHAAPSRPEAQSTVPAPKQR